MRHRWRAGTTRRACATSRPTGERRIRWRPTRVGRRSAAAVGRGSGSDGAGSAVRGARRRRARRCAVELRLRRRAGARISQRAHAGAAGQAGRRRSPSPERQPVHAPQRRAAHHERLGIASRLADARSRSRHCVTAGSILDAARCTRRAARRREPARVMAQLAQPARPRSSMSDSTGTRRGERRQEREGGPLHELPARTSRLHDPAQPAAAIKALPAALLRARPSTMRSARAGGSRFEPVDQNMLLPAPRPGVGSQASCRLVKSPTRCRSMR